MTSLLHMLVIVSYAVMVSHVSCLPILSQFHQAELHQIFNSVQPKIEYLQKRSLDDGIQNQTDANLRAESNNDVKIPAESIIQVRSVDTASNNLTQNNSNSTSNNIQTEKRRMHSARRLPMENNVRSVNENANKVSSDVEFDAQMKQVFNHLSQLIDTYKEVDSNMTQKYKKDITDLWLKINSDHDSDTKVKTAFLNALVSVDNLISDEVSAYKAIELFFNQTFHHQKPVKEQIILEEKLLSLLSKPPFVANLTVRQQTSKPDNENYPYSARMLMPQNIEKRCSDCDSNVVLVKEYSVIHKEPCDDCEAHFSEVKKETCDDCEADFSAIKKETCNDCEADFPEVKKEPCDDCEADFSEAKKEICHDCEEDFSEAKKETCHDCEEDFSETKKETCHDCEGISKEVRKIISNDCEEDCEVQKEPCDDCEADFSEAKKEICHDCEEDFSEAKKETCHDCEGISKEVRKIISNDCEEDCEVQKEPCDDCGSNVEVVVKETKIKMTEKKSQMAEETCDHCEERIKNVPKPCNDCDAVF